MRLSVYYEEIDGLLLPLWLLVPARTVKDYETYSVEAPFERFYPEDFHDELAIVTITQGALTRCPFIEHQFDIHIPTVKTDLQFSGKPSDVLDSAKFFLIRIDDLEELLQFSLRKHFNN